MPRLLLVHDDLRSTERVLRLLALREPQWELEHVASIADAWKRVEEWQPDAVVAAAKAPELDGIELLSRVQHAYPNTVRIAVGVDGEAEKGLRTLRIAHRAVTEPIEVATLQEMVKRLLLLNALVSRPPVRELLGRMGPLPAVPSVYTKLSRRLEDPNASVFELSEMIAADSTLAAQVLRIANSAFFGHHQHVTKIEAAAARLGTRLLKSLVLTAEVYNRFPVSPFMVERLEALQTHASLVARIAANLEPGTPWRDDAFTAGLLHDIGKLLLAAYLPDLHASIVREAEREGRPEHEIELQRMGAHHGGIGACLLGMWGLPSEILEAADRHHDPLPALPAALDPVSAVTIADALAHGATSTVGPHSIDLMWPEPVLKDPRWPQWRELAIEAAGRQAAA